MPECDSRDAVRVELELAIERVARLRRWGGTAEPIALAPDFTAWVLKVMKEASCALKDQNSSSISIDYSVTHHGSGEPPVGEVRMQIEREHNLLAETARRLNQSLEERNERLGRAEKAVGELEEENGELRRRCARLQHAIDRATAAVVGVS